MYIFTYTCMHIYIYIHSSNLIFGTSPPESARPIPKGTSRGLLLVALPEVVLYVGGTKRADKLAAAKATTVAFAMPFPSASNTRACMNESCHVYESCHIYESCQIWTSHVWTSNVKLQYEASKRIQRLRLYEWVMSRVCAVSMWVVSCMSESCHICYAVSQRIQHTCLYEWVMSHSNTYTYTYIYIYLYIYIFMYT